MSQQQQPKSAALGLLDEEERLHGSKLPGSLRELLMKKAKEAEEKKRDEEQADHDGGEGSSATTNSQTQSATIGSPLRTPRRFAPATTANASTVPAASDGMFDIESLIDAQHLDGKFVFMVKWVGYRVDESTWEPLSSVVGFKDLLRQYRRAYPNKPFPTKEEIAAAEEEASN